VTAGGQRQLIGGQPVGPFGEQDAHGNVLVDHDHKALAGSDVAAVRLLGQGRQSTGQEEELLGPRRQGHVGAAGVEPAAPVYLDLDLPEVALRVSLAGESLGALAPQRVAVSGAVVAGSFLDATPSGTSLGALWEQNGSEPGGFRGLQRSLAERFGRREHHP